MTSTAERLAYNPEYKDEMYVYRHTGRLVLTKGMKEGWADPMDSQKVNFQVRPSFMGSIEFDNAGRPLNPYRTEYMAGDRGRLGKWGPNNAADSVVVANGKILLIRRSDGSGQWALPGGMVDPGEKVSRTARRELLEEAGIDLGDMAGELLYEGYVDDPRNTRNAWMETTARLFQLDYTPQPKAGDDAVEACWFDCPDIESLVRETQQYDESLGLPPQSLYASHEGIISQGLLMLVA